MKKKYIIIITLIIVMGVSLVGFAGYSVFSKFKSNNKGSKEKVALYTVQGNQTLFFEGEFQNANKLVFQYDLSKGILDKVNVTDKQKVKAGDILFTYKNTQVIQQRDSLNDQLNSLKITYNRLQKQADQQVTAVNSISNQLAQNQTKEQIQEQLDDNKRQQQSLTRQINDLNTKCYTEIKAPFEGIVVKGEYSEVETSKPILTLTSDKKQIVCNVGERDILKLRVDQEVNISVYGTGQSIKGKIKYVATEPTENNMVSMGSAVQVNSGASGSSVGGSTSYYTVNIEPDNVDGLYSGFHVQVSTKASNDIPKIPKTAVFTEGEISYVWVVKDGVLKKTEVEVTDWNEKYVQVKKGVTFEDKVVRQSKDSMKEGDKIDESDKN
jgi:HlyD family secretion protein